MSNFTDFIGGGGSASQINEVVTLSNTADTVTLADGRVYLKGGVVETNPSTYPLASTSIQQAGSFSVGAQEVDPRAVTFDGTHYWVVGSSNDTAYKYTAAGVYTGTSFSVASQMSNPYGIEWDGNYFWVMSNTGFVYKYNAAGVYQSVNWSANAQTSSDARDIAWDGTFFYIVVRLRTVYKYTAAGVYTGTSFDVSGQTTGEASGIASAGNYFWVGDDVIDKVFKYNSSFVYQDESFATASYEGAIQALGYDGTNLLMIGYTSDKVWKFAYANGVASVLNLGGQNYVRVA